MYNHLTISDSITPEQRSIIEAYWQVKDRHFVNTPQQVATKYKLTLNRLNKLVEQFSIFEFQYGKCIECEVHLIMKTTLQKDIAKIYANSFALCSTCRNVQELELQFRNGLKN